MISLSRDHLFPFPVPARTKTFDEYFHLPTSPTPRGIFIDLLLLLKNGSKSYHVQWGRTRDIKCGRTCHDVCNWKNSTDRLNRGSHVPEAPWVAPKFSMKSLTVKMETKKSHDNVRRYTLLMIRFSPSGPTCHGSPGCKLCGENSTLVSTA